MPYRMNRYQVLKELGSDENIDLSEQEAKTRLSKNGKNELVKQKKRNTTSRCLLSSLKIRWSSF